MTSPKGVVDPQSGMYILQYRDQSSGEVTRQYPSQKVVAAYRKGDNEVQQAKPQQAPAEGSAVPVPTGVAAETAGVAVQATAPATTSAPSTGAAVSTAGSTGKGAPSGEA
ncbi:MAG: hypothetical protein HQL36_02755 [Alphaproteobacteria bacterium]|nr:hypothetical protein [Alphaproteobacteria bacterium]